MEYMYTINIRGQIFTYPHEEFLSLDRFPGFIYFMSNINYMTAQQTVSNIESKSTGFRAKQYMFVVLVYHVKHYCFQHIKIMGSQSNMLFVILWMFFFVIYTVTNPNGKYCGVLAVKLISFYQC